MIPINWIKSVFVQSTGESKEEGYILCALSGSINGIIIMEVNFNKKRTTSYLESTYT